MNLRFCLRLVLFTAIQIHSMETDMILSPSIPSLDIP